MATFIDELVGASKTNFERAYELDLSTDKIEWFGNRTGRLGYSRSELPKTLTAGEELIHPDDYRHVREKIQLHLKTQEPYFEMYRVQQKSGEFIYVIDFGTALRDHRGVPSKWIGLMQISEKPVHFLFAG